MHIKHYHSIAKLRQLSSQGRGRHCTPGYRGTQIGIGRLEILLSRLDVVRDDRV